ncbi:hypothetical protein KSF_108570 [Reticulibacter mediterranei]|uniref:Peptidase S24/S26A/S26B/S26C domain-containing protein n=1 Tax=Reticulibacter mediterranei TaxID=2778369 RepID=A0A8J3N743_9CHLR|nr:S24 family peptidase [Reticulibacter mediterranei]GHP00810.1 hypothetical protein KSF_108570 [Reticulibacter mediterranei]
MSDALPPSSEWQPGGETTGFPSPAHLWRERVLSLNDVLLCPEATYFVCVRGHAMRKAGISDHDLLVVDRSVPARNGSFVVAQVETTFVVRRLSLEGARMRLLSAHPSYPPIEVEPSVAIWGVVIYVLHATTPWSKQRLKETLPAPKPSSDPDL